ncbi:MAG: CDP-diacylglycerol--glycerol-3-phosphate 3-phosphatidyltransferase [Candidatus Geothermincolia bacterium]
MPAPDKPVRARSTNLNVPNLLSVLRIALTPAIILLVAQDTPRSRLGAFLVLGVCGITDMLDGKLARKMGLVTSLGAFLDPLADKFYIGGALIVLAAMSRISVWVPALILGREIGITLFRIYAGSKHISVPASILGKLKANLQLAAILVAILHFSMNGSYVHEHVLMWAAVALTLYSGGDYLWKARRILAGTQA